MTQRKRNLNIYKYETNQIIINGLVTAVVILSGLLLSLGQSVPVSKASQPLPRFLSGGDGSWFWLNPSPQGSSLNGIDCPGIAYCFAVGDDGTIIASTDGVNWQGQNLPPTLYQQTNLRGISCPTTQICYAVGTGGKIVAAVNSPWTLQPSSTTEDLNAISCPGVTTCFAVGKKGTIIATTDGHTWSAQPNLPDTLANIELSSISCPTTQVCYAVGANGTIVGAVNSPWSVQNANNIIYTLNGISCPNISKCFIQDIKGAVYELMQSSWALRLTGASPLYGISCPDNLNCFGVGDSGKIVASVNYSPWNLQSSPTTQTLTGISCPSTSVCYAVGKNGAIVTTTNSGSVWKETSNIATIHNLNSVSCPSSNVCYAAGTGGVIVKYDNSINNLGWFPQNSPTAKDLNGISCPGLTTCFAVGVEGTIIATTDGTNWSPQPNLPPGLNLIDLKAISCPSTQVCYAVGTKGTIVAAVNSPWTSQDGPTGQDLNGINCPAVDTCFVVGNNKIILNTQISGQYWFIQNPPVGSGLANLYSVSCPTTQTCYAVGDGGKIIVRTNGAWAFQSSGIGTILYAVSCVNSNNCTAVGNGGTVVTTSGSGWKTEVTGTSATLVGINCLVRCVSVGQAGTILTNAQVVTNPTDNNANNSTTLSYAINRAGPGQRIRFFLPNNVITLSNPLPQLLPGVRLEGNCDPVDGPKTVFDASGSLIPAPTLGNNNTLFGIRLKHFSTPIKAVASADGGVHLGCMAVQH